MNALLLIEQELSIPTLTNKRERAPWEGESGFFSPWLYVSKLALRVLFLSALALFGRDTLWAGEERQHFGGRAPMPLGGENEGMRGLAIGPSGF